MKHHFLSAVALAFVLVACAGARAQTEITLIAPVGAKAPVDDLIPGFEAQANCKVTAAYGSGLGTKARITKGDAFDVVIVQPPYPEVLASGNVAGDTATPLATVAVGVAVRKGAPKPDISTADAVKKVLLAAQSITYPDPKIGAAAGVSFVETLKKLGVWDEMQPKIKPGNVAAVAKGDVEIGFTFLSEINEPGVDIVGPLPREISTPTGLVGFVSAHAKDPKAAKALLEYLSAPAAAAVYQAHRMQPGS